MQERQEHILGVHSDGKQIQIWTPGWVRASSVPCLQRRPMVSQAALHKLLSSGGERWSLPAIQHWCIHTWSTLTSSGLLSTKETWAYWWRVQQRAMGWLRSKNTSCTRRGWESWDSLGWRRGGLGRSSQGIWITEEKVQRRCSQILLSDAQWQKKSQCAQSEIEEGPPKRKATLFHCKGQLEQVAVSPSMEVFQAILECPEKLPLRDPAWAGV